MLSHLDFIIFPDRCEVIEIIPSQRYFYPIFKNGSSSVYEQAKVSKWKIFLNDKIGKVPSVDVIIREPQQRLVSGVNSFVTQTLKSNPGLDKNTIIWFAKNYLHLNRHYSMQYAWLVNLARYMRPDAKINLLGLSDIAQFTDLTMDPWGQKDINVSTELVKLTAQEMYHRVDQVIYNSIGSSLTFSEINKLIQTQDPSAYTHVIQRAQNILKPTYAMPKT